MIQSQDSLSASGRRRQESHLSCWRASRRLSRGTALYQKQATGGYLLRIDLFFNDSARISSSSDCLQVALTLFIDCLVMPGVFISVATRWNGFGNSSRLSCSQVKKSVGFSLGLIPYCGLLHSHTINSNGKVRKEEGRRKECLTDVLPLKETIMSDLWSFIRKSLVRL